MKPGSGTKPSERSSESPDGNILPHHIERTLTGLFETLADNLDAMDDRPYGKFQVAFVKTMGIMVASGAMDLADAPKLLLDLEKLKSADASGGKKSGGDLLRSMNLEHAAK